VARPTYPLTTERLLLRPFTEGDLEAVYAIESRPDVMRYLYWEPRTRDEARAALDRRVKMTSLDGEPSALRLAVVRRD